MAGKIPLNTFFDSPFWGVTLYAQVFPINSFQNPTISHTIAPSHPLSSMLNVFLTFCSNNLPLFDDEKHLYLKCSIAVNLIKKLTNRV